MRLLLLLLLLWPAWLSAEPLRFETQMGICNQGLAPDGIWWSSLYPTDIDRRSFCWQAGISQAPWKYQDWSFGWRAAYVDLGKVTADNQWSYLEPQRYYEGTDCDSATSEGCRGRGQIKQTTRGVTLGVLTEHKAGDFTLGAEGGLYLYRSVFKVDISSTPDPSSVPSSSYKWASNRTTGYYGLSAQYGYLFATARVYSNIRATEEYCQECGGITGGKAWQATMGVQVPF